MQPSPSEVDGSRKKKKKSYAELVGRLQGAEPQAVPARVSQGARPGLLFSTLVGSRRGYTQAVNCTRTCDGGSVGRIILEKMLEVPYCTGSTGAVVEPREKD